MELERCDGFAAADPLVDMARRGFNGYGRSTVNVVAVGGVVAEQGARAKVEA